MFAANVFSEHFLALSYAFEFQGETSTTFDQSIACSFFDEVFKDMGYFDFSQQVRGTFDYEVVLEEKKFCGLFHRVQWTSYQQKLCGAQPPAQLSILAEKRMASLQVILYVSHSTHEEICPLAMSANHFVDAVLVPKKMFPQKQVLGGQLSSFLFLS